MTSDKRIVIGLVGRKGSGKGTVARLIKDDYLQQNSYTK